MLTRIKKEWVKIMVEVSIDNLKSSHCKYNVYAVVDIIEDYKNRGLLTEEEARSYSVKAYSTSIKKLARCLRK